MRERCAYSGLFIAVNTDANKTRTVKSETVDLAGLTAALRGKASDLTTNHPTYPDIRVIAADLTTPF